MLDIENEITHVQISLLRCHQHKWNRIKQANFLIFKRHDQAQNLSSQSTVYSTAQFIPISHLSGLKYGYRFTLTVNSIRPETINHAPCQCFRSSDQVHLLSVPGSNSKSSGADTNYNFSSGYLQTGSTYNRLIKARFYCQRTTTRVPQCVSLIESESK